jgi:hypothetical protein
MAFCYSFFPPVLQERLRLSEVKSAALEADLLDSEGALMAAQKQVWKEGNCIRD